MNNPIPLTEEEERYLTLPHPISLKWFQDEEDAYYIASIPLLNGCHADGKTAKEALHNLVDAKISWIQAHLDARLDIPLSPTNTPIVEIQPPYTKEEVEDMRAASDDFAAMLATFLKKHADTPFFDR